MSDVNGFDGEAPFRKRATNTQGAKRWPVGGPLFLPMFLQNKLLMPLVQIDLVFTLAQPTFCLRSNNAAMSYKPQLHNFRIEMKRIKVAAHVSQQIETKLQKEPCLYPIRHTDIRMFTIGPNTPHYEVGKI